MSKMSRNSNEILIVDNRKIEDKVYVVRGVQVMLDFELAEIYGYETKSFNRQVKNNIQRFEGDEFRFQLTKEEFNNLRCKNCTSSWGGTRYMPYAFTEQGVYMLMTVLKGDLAVEQSRKLIKMFKRMKEYIETSQPLLNTSIKLLAMQTEENTETIKRIERSMVTHDDLTDFMKLFDKGIKNEEFLILDGEPFKADLAYQRIYKLARKSIIIVDDYIGPKTLFHLAKANKNIRKIIISDNKGTGLRLHEYEDFIAEYPGYEVQFIKTNKRAHDRYIVLDYGTRDFKVYHCGASSKDAGRRITSIAEVKEPQGYKEAIKSLLKNQDLKLK